MANYLSAGVYSSEQDLSTTVAPTSTGSTAFAGEFDKGETFSRILITSITELEKVLGLPTDKNYNDWFQAYNFLKKGNELYVVRAVDDASETITDYDPYVLGKTYLQGEGVNYTDTDGTHYNLHAATLTSAEPQIASGVIQNSADWVQDTTVNIVRNKTMNAGLDITAAGNLLFTNSYIANRNVYSTTYDSKTLNTGSVINFTAVSPGINGNNIEISFSNDMSKGIEKPVTTTWIGANGTTWLPATTYALSDIVFYQDRIYKSLTASNTDVPTNTSSWQDVSVGIGIVVNYNGNNWYSNTSNNADTPSETSTKWTKGTIFGDLFNYTLNTNEIAFVIFENGKISEKYILSTDPLGVDGNNNNIYIDNVINHTSALIYSFYEGGALPSLVQQAPLAGGIYSSPTIFNLNSAYDLFRNTEDFDVMLVIANEKINKYCTDLAKSREDCLAIAGARKQDTVGNLDAVQSVVNYIQSDLNDENSYAAFYGNYIQITDNYNSKYRWVNIAGMVAGNQVQTNDKQNPWWADAGIERGQLSDVIKLAFNPDQGDRNVLYKNKINPVISTHNSGNAVIWGQKTLLSRKSAFDRINVRMLFLVIEKSVNKTMKKFVFDFNDEFTRAQIISMLVPYFENILGLRGIYDYKIVCDNTINTPAVIDANELRLNIFIKPTKIAEYISISYVATRTGDNLIQLAKTVK